MSKTGSSGRPAAKKDKNREHNVEHMQRQGTHLCWSGTSSSLITLTLFTPANRSAPQGSNIRSGPCVAPPLPTSPANASSAYRVWGRCLNLTVACSVRERAPSEGYAHAFLPLALSRAALVARAAALPRVYTRRTQKQDRLKGLLPPPRPKTPTASVAMHLPRSWRPPSGPSQGLVPLCHPADPIEGPALAELFRLRVLSPRRYLPP